jgi:DNA-binding XRE family transcriptional regulator
METKNEKLKRLGFVSHKDVVEKTYGKVGKTKRDDYEKELKMEVLGEFLRQVRRKKNYTQEQVAEIMGTDKTYISKIENNLKDTKLTTIRKYVEALKIPKLSLRLEFEDGSPAELQLI